MRNLAISAGLGDFVVTMVVVSLSLVLAAQVCGFWSRQFYTRYPCLLHSKQWPSFVYFSFLASVVAFYVTADISIVSRSHSGKCRWGACPIDQFS